ncbi:hypothetical protein Leryth_007539 [Lithospermum erythrorhizon]|nr:hypothetical protein Leryth_007539 [Lithospermum erythrorhizon]
MVLHQPVNHSIRRGTLSSTRTRCGQIKFLVTAQIYYKLANANAKEQRHMNYERLSELQDIRCIPDQQHIENFVFAFHPHILSMVAFGLPVQEKKQSISTASKAHFKVVEYLISRTNLSNKVADHTSIVKAHTRPICIKNTCNSNLYRKFGKQTCKNKKP